MATFPTPDRAVAAALRMREAMHGLKAGDRGEDMLLNGIHEVQCLAVMLNDRQDYFGQTVNIASRVQGLRGCARHGVAVGGRKSGRPPPSWRRAASPRRVVTATRPARRRQR